MSRIVGFFSALLAALAAGTVVAGVTMIRATPEAGHFAAMHGCYGTDSCANTCGGCWSPAPTYWSCGCGVVDFQTSGGSWAWYCGCSSASAGSTTSW